MKPFDLDAAIEGSTVVTRDGRKVTEIYFFYTAETEYPVHACIDKHIYHFRKDGTVYINGSSHLDLFIKEPIVEGWVNVYYRHYINKMWTSDVHPTYEQAINKKGDSIDYIKTIKIDNTKP